MINDQTFRSLELGILILFAIWNLEFIYTTKSSTIIGTRLKRKRHSGYIEIGYLPYCDAASNMARIFSGGISG
jgi:hypothetical protein